MCVFVTPGEACARRRGRGPSPRRLDKKKATAHALKKKKEKKTSPRSVAARIRGPDPSRRLCLLIFFPRIAFRAHHLNKHGRGAWAARVLPSLVGGGGEAGVIKKCAGPEVLRPRPSIGPPPPPPGGPRPRWPARTPQKCMVDRLSNLKRCPIGNWTGGIGGVRQETEGGRVVGRRALGGPTARESARAKALTSAQPQPFSTHLPLQSRGTGRGGEAQPPIQRPGPASHTHGTHTRTHTRSRPVLTPLMSSHPPDHHPRRPPPPPARARRARPARRLRRPPHGLRLLRVGGVRPRRA